MPRQTLDPTVERQHTQRESLEATRAQLASALQAVQQGRHVDDVRTLEQRQQQLLAPAGTEAREALGVALDGQRRLVDGQHSAEITLINKALDSAGRLSRDTPNAARQVADLLEAATRANSAIAQFTKEALQASHRQLESAVAVTDPSRRRERIDAIVHDERSALRQLERSHSTAMRDIQRTESLARNLLNGGDAAALRRTMAAEAKTDQLRGVLTDRVLQRLADEALVPGSSRLGNAKTDAVVQRVKGELAEQIALARVRDDVARENQNRRPDRQLFVIDGNRVRDDHGRKLTDGLIVWRNAANQLQLWRALEVKAGVESARALNEKIDKLTRKDGRELRAFARDLARDSGRHPSAATDAEMAERISVEEARLRSRDIQRQEGQAAQTRERLDVVEHIRIDGKTEVLVRDTNERLLQDAVLKAVADDALRADKEALRLGVTAGEIEAMAKAFVDELMRRREA